MLKKNDIILVLSIVFTAVLIMIFGLFVPNGGKTVTVKQNNKTVYTGALREDNQIKLPSNTVVIENGEVYMLKADCKNQICVKHKKISKNGESIVCLPNKVTVEIEK